MSHQDPRLPAIALPWQSSTGARVLNWAPVDGNPALLGRVTIAFAGGWIVNSIPVFKRADGSLTAGVPSAPIVGSDGVHQRDEAGKKRYAPLIGFSDRDARARWEIMILAALEAASIGATP